MSFRYLTLRVNNMCPWMCMPTWIMFPLSCVNLLSKPDNGRNYVATNPRKSKATNRLCLQWSGLWFLDCKTQRGMIVEKLRSRLMRQGHAYKKSRKCSSAFWSRFDTVLWSKPNSFFDDVLATPEKASHMKLAAAQFELLQSKDFEGDVTLGFAAVHPISFTWSTGKHSGQAGFHSTQSTHNWLCDYLIL